MVLKEIEAKIEAGEILTEKEARFYNKATKPKQARSRFYNLDSILGYDWAVFRVLVGPRMCGKSYAVTERMCKLHKKLGQDVKIYWLRVSETSTKAMLANKAAKLVDPDLVRKYDLDLSTKAFTVFDHGEPFMEVFPLSAAAKLKGTAFFDKDFHGKYIIAFDEFITDASAEKRTSFDPTYTFIQMIENLVRTTKTNIEVWLMANNVNESAGILSRCFNFVPLQVGRFKLHSKRAVIDVIPATEEYKRDRAGSLASLLGGADSNFSDKMVKDMRQVYKGPVYKPTSVIKFSKSPDDWFSVYDGAVVRPYKGECKPVVAMRPYLDELFDRGVMMSVIERYDARAFLFNSLATQVKFTEALSRIRK